MEQDSEDLQAPMVRGPAWDKKKTFGATVGTILLLGTVAVASYSYGATSTADHQITPLDMTRHIIAENEFEITPPHQACSKAIDNCMSTGCCQTTGMKCFQIPIQGVGKCMLPEKCQGCPEVAHHTAPVANYPGMSFYCFSVYVEDTGSEKVNHHYELLKAQKEAGVSIFRCPEHAVFSDVEVGLAGGESTIRVFDVKGDWHFAKRKHKGTWVNTGMFFQVWKEIQKMGAYQRHDYVVKVDPTSVFFPNKLVEWLRNKPVPAEGLYYENCEGVEYGYFGNLEVFSQTAFDTLLGNMDQCYGELNWKVGVQGGKWGPMGEDLFAQKCMDNHGVRKVENFGLTLDGSCPHSRPADQKKNRNFVPSCQGATAATIHPLKTTNAYFACMETADQVMPR